MQPPVATPHGGYVEWVPAGPLAGVRCVGWWLSAPAASALEQLHLPHGGVEVRWARGHGPVVVGPTSAMISTLVPPGGDIVGLRFALGAWSSTVGPAALAGVTAPVADVMGVACDADAWAGPSARAAALRQTVGTAVVRRPAPVADAAVRAICVEDASVRSLARRLDRSERQLRRLVRSRTGLTVRDVRRIVRFQRFVALVQQDVAGRHARSLAELAATAGYADQSHLHRACRAFTRLTPGQYLARTTLRCAGHDHRASYEGVASP